MDANFMPYLLGQKYSYDGTSFFALNYYSNRTNLTLLVCVFLYVIYEPMHFAILLNKTTATGFEQILKYNG